MKIRKIGMRMLSALLILCCLLGLMPTTGLFSTKVEAADTNWDVNGDGTLSILCIGNSFSTDAMEYLYQIAQNLGVSDLYLANLYIGGCTLNTHITNANGDTAAYTYYYNSNGDWKSTKNYKMSTALTSREWDYISLQQASANSGQETTYNNDLTNLVAYVKSKAPTSKLVWHMTWAYQSDSTHSAFANYSKNQSTMYSKIVSAVMNKIVTNSDFSIIVPNGTAIQNARSSLIKDNLCRDGYHLNEYIGRYIAGLTFLKALGISIDSITWVPQHVPEAYKVIAIESANNAVANPYQITNSAHTNPKSSAYYTQLNLSFSYNCFWNSTSADAMDKLYTPESTASQYKKFYATNKRYTYGTLPVGSVIYLSSGYRYRPEGWIGSGIQSSREGMVTASYTVCSNEWWENDDGVSYVYRSFNISKSDGSTMNSGLENTLKSAFQIWVPIEAKESSYDPLELAGDINGLSDPVPNNFRKDWTGLSDVQAMDGKTEYIVVSYASSLPKATYALDPTTPRLQGTFHAAPVTVKTVNGVERVYGADQSWTLDFQYWGGDTVGNVDKDGNVIAPYTSGSTTCRAAFKVRIPKNALDSDALYIMNNVSYSKGAVKNLSTTTWRLRDSTWVSALTDQKNGSTVVTKKAVVQQNARMHLFVNWNNDRMHFVFEPLFDSSVTDKNAKTSLRSMFANPATEEPYFYMGIATDTGTNEYEDTPVSNYAAFMLYEVNKSMADTTALYNKLKEAAGYLDDDTTYCFKEYKTLLDAIHNALGVYTDENGITTDTNAQKRVNAALNTLTDAIDGLNVQTIVNSIAIPFTKKTSIGNANSGCANGKLNGTYFLLREYNASFDRVCSTIDFSTLSGGDYGIKRYDVTDSSTSGYGIQANDLSDAITLRYVDGTTYGYTMQRENGSFIIRSAEKFTALSNPTQFNF